MRLEAQDEAQALAQALCKSQSKLPQSYWLTNLKIVYLPNGFSY